MLNATYESASFEATKPSKVFSLLCYARVVVILNDRSTDSSPGQYTPRLEANFVGTNSQDVLLLSTGQSPRVVNVSKLIKP